MNKKIYQEVADIINARLQKLDYEGVDLKPYVSVADTSQHGKYYGKYSLRLNDDLYELVQRKGPAQDMFYANEVYVVGDYDFYLEPVTRTYFDLAVM